MLGNSHARFLGEWWSATAATYPINIAFELPILREPCIAILIDAGVQSLGRPKVLFKYSSEHYPCSLQGQANALLCDIKSRRSYVPTFFTVIVQQWIRMIHVDKPDFISVFR